MEPAPIEHLSVLRAKSGEEVDQEIYTFKDKSGRELGLRFDLTVGMTRYVCSRRDLRPPIKLACVGGAWRYEEPQHARYRWFKQWDLEIFGTPSVGSDAEVIAASDRVYEMLGISSRVLRIGDRRVVEEFITKVLGVEDKARALELMRALDKVQKKSLRELEGEYAGKGFKRETISALFEFGSLNGPPEKVLGRLSELKMESAGEMAALKDALVDRGLRELEYNMSIVRGLDYYTAVVFEVSDRNHLDLGSLCGGGRYDLLPSLFGRPELSATGAAGGLERAAVSLGALDRTPDWVYVVSTDSETRKVALAAVTRLRAAGRIADVDETDKSLSKKLATASAMGAPWTMIIGRREAAEKVVTLKNMKTGAEERLSLEEAIARVSPAGD